MKKCKNGEALTLLSLLCGGKKKVIKRHVRKECKKMSLHTSLKIVIRKISFYSVFGICWLISASFVYC